MLVTRSLANHLYMLGSNPKGHGKNMIEGYFHESLQAIVIEDLISTGSIV